MGMASLLFIVVGLGGCVLFVVAAGAVVWVILGERKHTEKD
jgi:hypothetical protein